MKKKVIAAHIAPTTDIKIIDDRLCITGDLNFWTVVEIYEKSILLFQDQKRLKIDFANVQKANSAAIALIIEWIKLAKNLGKSIEFFYLPKNISVMLKTAEMEGMVPLNPERLPSL